MEVEAFDLVQFCRCGFVGTDGMAERVFVGVEKDTLGVVVSSAAVGV